MSFNMNSDKLDVKVYETSSSGNKLKPIQSFIPCKNKVVININPETQFQTITGIGGSFTESSAYLFKNLSLENQSKILEAYFGDNGAKYSLTRTHINSCDFSLNHYAYAMVPGDSLLTSFDISHDKEYLIPMIQRAQQVSTDGFKIISSPWTAPPWMKDNNSWIGGRLLPRYYDTWALYFSKYIQSYRQEGLNVWGITVENEPLGNGNNWESMHYTPDEMTRFVTQYLGPQLEKDGLSDIKILGYDQNRDHLKEWVNAMYESPEVSKYFSGTAIHWYASTQEVFEDALQFAHAKAPDKYLIETEGCIDAEIPHWKDDVWYWSEEATDWGWDWASESEKHLHPKYTPTFRYAKDMIGCLNNWVDGWIDWNLILDRQGGPNWFKNWCTAPVIVDIDLDEVYFTPLYYVMSHFSKYIRPESKVIKVDTNTDKIMATAVINPDQSLAIVVLNEQDYPQELILNIYDKSTSVTISPHAIQTIIFSNMNVSL